MVERCMGTFFISLIQNAMQALRQLLWQIPTIPDEEKGPKRRESSIDTYYAPGQPDLCWQLQCKTLLESLLSVDSIQQRTPEENQQLFADLRDLLLVRVAPAEQEPIVPMVALAMELIPLLLTAGSTMKWDCLEDLQEFIYSIGEHGRPKELLLSLLAELSTIEEGDLVKLHLIFVLLLAGILSYREFLYLLDSLPQNHRTTSQ